MGDSGLNMQNIPGFYGKLPMLGDFVNRRLPKEFVYPLDEWLQLSLAHSKDVLKESWLNCYLQSPIWRFILCPEVCGSDPWMGLIMPSVDKVGRYYPLVLGCKLVKGCNPIEVLTVGCSWFEMADETILSILSDEQIDLEVFDERVTSLGGISSKLTRCTGNLDVGYGTSWQVSMINNSVQNSISILAHQLLYQRLGEYSIWWGPSIDKDNASMLVCSGLPSPANFASLLTGRWDMGDWEQWPTPSPIEAPMVNQILV